MMRTRTLLALVLGAAIGLVARDGWDAATGEARSIADGPRYAVIITYPASQTRLAWGPWRYDEAVAFSRRKAGRGGAEVEIVGLEP